jgi:hypothetical protein
LDGQGNFAEIVAPEYVLVPDNKLESAHGLGEREVDGKFESGILRGIDGVECGFDIRGLFSFTKKRDDYVAAGSNQRTGTLEVKRRNTRVALAVAVHGEEVLAATDLDLQVERGLLAWLGPYWSCHPARLADRNDLCSTGHDGLAETSWHIRGRVGRVRYGRRRLWGH